MATKAKKWYASKSIWLGLISIAIGILGFVQPWIEAGDFTLPSIILLVIGVLQLIARYLTDSPIKLK